MDRISLSLIAAGLASLATALAAPSLIRVNLLAYRLLGLEEIARFWERRLAWWVPVVRLVAASGALVVAFVLMALIWS